MHNAPPSEPDQPVEIAPRGPLSCDDEAVPAGANRREVAVPVLPGAEPFVHEGSDDVGVLLCHGFTSTPQSMRDWGEHLAAEGISVRCPRLPGHGTAWRELNRTRWTDWYATVEREFGLLRSTCRSVFVFGQSMGGALAFWMGNPLLNPATLVFMGFVLGWQFALVRLVAGLATVLTVATLVQKWVKEAATQPVAVPDVQAEASQGGFFSRWLRALWTLFWNTIPVYILAVLVLGAARVWLFPHADGVVDNTLFWVIAMAIAGCLFVIPTAAEIPIVQTMMLAGMGTAPALALLITLPAVSVPSLIMLRKAFPAKALWLTGGLVALCGAIVGALALV